MSTRIAWIGLGLIGYYASSYLSFLGLQYVSAGIERLILYLNPTLVLLMSAAFLGKRIETPGFQLVRARDGMARPAPVQPVGAAITGHGSAGMVAPGTFALAMVFLVSFVLYYFINWKYLATVWPLK